MHINSNTLTKSQVVGLILISYLFSFFIRMIWVWQFQDNPSFAWNDQMMINTNDGYFFAAGAQHALFDMHQFNPRIPDIYSYGVVFLTTMDSTIDPF